MLGFDVSERSVSRWMKPASRNPELARRSLPFLCNHREAITAMDFFTVPTVTFQVLYWFFIIKHDRRQIVHFNVTRHPTSSCIVQQLSEAFSLRISREIPALRSRPEIRILAALRSLQISCVRTSIQRPWQNGVAERWVKVAALLCSITSSL
jgi:hypothetical protein